MTTSKNPKKNKGKGISRAEDYQLEVPIQFPLKINSKHLLISHHYHTKLWLQSLLQNLPLTMRMLFDI